MPSTKKRMIVPSNVLIISKCSGGFNGDTSAVLTLAGDPGLVPTAHGVLMYSQGVPLVTHRLHCGNRWSQHRLSFAHA